MTEHKTTWTWLNTKKLNMTERRADMNITEKLNSTFTAAYKTNMNITEKLSSPFTKEHS